MKNTIKYHFNYFKYSLKYLLGRGESKVRAERKMQGYRSLIDHFSGRLDNQDTISRLDNVNDYFPSDESLPVRKYKKNAVFVYSYEPEKQSEDYYYPGDVNIGDYIQSLAASQFVGDKNVEYIDRDNVRYYNSDEVNLIANGWYFFYEGNKIFSSKVNPLFVSFHINNQESVSSETIDYLKKHQPIGCRDYSTMDFLISNNVDAYFSSCLTTTLSSYAVNDDERNGKVIFCDFDDSNIFISEIIRDIVGKGIVEKTTHSYEKNMSHETYFAEAKRLLNIYARAKLVVTTRIHCALPCLAMNTPVILSVPVYDKTRFKGLDEMLNLVGYDENGQLFTKIAYDRNGNVINPENHLVYADRLRKVCTSFVTEAA